MQKKYLYFQPAYVDKFKCDGAKCDAHCCKGWDIFVDKKTFERYSRLGAHLTKHIRPADEKEYRIELDERGNCPFLTEKKLCRIQLEHGENFLSLVCKTYPRILTDFGKFSERALSLTCPVAAELILFAREPLTFELKEILRDESIGLSPMCVPKKFVAHLIDIQIAMLSILQERTLSIDQRLIVLGFFLDKLDEISAGEFDDALTKLVAAYESSVRFDAKKFVLLMLKIFNELYGGLNMGDKQIFLDAVVDALKLKPDENNFVSVANVAANYERLADDRKIFTARYSTFLENFLVNEIFLNVCPWRFDGGIANNYAGFVTMFKVFELILFSTTLKDLDSRDNLLTLAGFLSSQINHSKHFQEKILASVKDFGDVFALMESLLQSR